MQKGLIWEIVKGYKATDKDMKCRGFKFELGVWHKHDGEIAMCESGFHFCEYPSGPWAFYSDKGTRMFKVEARGVIKSDDPGADLKHVAMEIRLVEEITITGSWNTGSWNTGDRNTGDRNTGDWNTGDRNTGDWNTGDWNTGSGNTGSGNATDKCSGYLCMKEPEFVIFDEPANKDDVDFCLVNSLCSKLMEDDDFEHERFLKIPNATLEKIKALHEAHKERRKKKMSWAT